MGLKDPIGKSIKVFGGKYHVIGVFDDFVWDTSYKFNDPMIIYFKKEHLGYITMRLNNLNKLKESIDKISVITKEINPTHPIEISFLNSIYEENLNHNKYLEFFQIFLQA